MSPLVDCVANGWAVSRGDAGALSWLITAFYGLAALACFADARREGDRGLSRFWTGLALALLFLGLNKQLDLQTSLTAYGKCLSVRQGWYESRRLVQMVFIAVALAVGLWVILRTLRVTWPHRASLGLAMAGIAALAVFVAGRAMGIYHVDTILGARLDLTRFWGPLEIGALAALLANALWLLRGDRPRN